VKVSLNICINVDVWRSPQTNPQNTMGKLYLYAIELKRRIICFCDLLTYILILISTYIILLM